MINRSKGHKFVRKILAFALIVLSLFVLLCATGCSAKFKDPTFESGKTSNWTVYNYEKSVGNNVSTVSIINESADGKGNSLKIQNNEANDCRAYQELTLGKKKTYKITVQVKIEGTITDGAGFNISAIGAGAHSESLYTTNNEWVTYTAYVKTGANQSKAEVAFCLGGYSAESTGTVYIDNIEIENVKTIPDVNKVVSLEKYVGTSTDDDTSDFETPVYFKILFLVLCIGLLVFVIAVTLKHDKEKHEQMLPLSEPKVKVKLRDIIIVLLLTAVTAVTSFYKLGNAYGPATSWIPTEAGEYVTVTFDEEVEIDRITFLTGEPTTGNGGYKVQYLDEYGLYQDIFSFYRSDSDKPEFFEWEIKDKDDFPDDIAVTTTSVRIECARRGLEFLELGFWDENKNAIPYTVTDVWYNTNNYNEGHTPDKVFDEPELVECYKTYENSTYFDEIYFPRTAYEHLNGYSIYEVTHPPLGKSIMSIGIAIFGMNPFGWRFMGALFGVLLIPILYFFALKLLKKSEYAFVATFLMMVDFMRTAQTRLATIDTYSVFFILLMYYFMYDYISVKSYERPFWRSMLPLALSGLFFGLGAAAKWTSIYAGVGLAILFFMSKFAEAMDVRTGRYQVRADQKSWFVSNFVPTCLMCVLFFVLIPAGIYVISYLPYMPSNEDKTLLQVVIENQKYMYNYHSTLDATHPYMSSWYSWMLDIKPIYYYSSANAGLAKGMRATVASFGNPLVWWVGLACIPSSLFFAWKKRSKSMLVAFIGYACQFFPWILVTRCTFIYHYFTAVPFLIIMIAYTIKNLIEDKAVPKWVIYIYLGLALFAYIIYFPILTATQVPSTYITKLRLFETWVF